MYVVLVSLLLLSSGSVKRAVDLDKITNPEALHFQDQVTSAVEGILKAQSALTTGKISEALHHASLARDAAEKSFSDPSILALLYFPDDQKFAIYIPLFLPVGLPLIVAYLEIMKQWKKSKDKTD